MEEGGLLPDSTSPTTTTLLPRPLSPLTNKDSAPLPTRAQSPLPSTSAAAVPTATVKIKVDSKEDRSEIPANHRPGTFVTPLVQGYAIRYFCYSVETEFD